MDNESARKTLLTGLVVVSCATVTRVVTQRFSSPTGEVLCDDPNKVCVGGYFDRY